MKQMHRSLVVLVLGVVLASCGGSPAASTTPVPATEPTAAVAEATPATQPTTAAEPTTDVQPTEAAEATAAPTEAATEATAAPTEAATEATAATDETATSVMPSEEELIPELQAVVDTWSDAQEEVDVKKLASAIDPKALTLRRTQTELLKYFSESIGGSSRDWSGTVREVVPRELGYVMAYVDIGGARYTFTFKQVNGKWLMSEPKRAELGKKMTQETDHFTFEYYAWDEPILPDIIKLMESADELVVGKLGKGPETKPLVQIIPTTEVGSRSSGRALAFYNRGSGAQRGSQIMVINSPTSYGFGGFPASSGWQGDLGVTLAHEFTHLVNDCCFVPIARQNDWMTEGLAEYISDGPISRQRLGTVELAVRSDAIIPIQTTDTSRYDKQDLEHLTLLDKDISLAYGLSSSVVNYIVENYGGLDGYWKLMGEFDKTQNLDTALQNAFGVTFQEFQDGWMADLHKKFGG